MRYITTDEIRRTLTMPEAIRDVREALVEQSTGRALVPARTSLEVPGRRTTALVMPACLPRAGRIGVKLISLCEDNPARGLPLAQAVIVVMDAERGTPLAGLKPGRGSEEEITLFKCVGNAVEDLAVAGLVIG